MKTLRKITALIVICIVTFAVATSCTVVTPYPKGYNVNDLSIDFVLTQEEVDEAKAVAEKGKKAFKKSGQEGLNEGLNCLYALIDWIYYVGTQSNISYIHYSCNQTDGDVIANYTFASEAYADVYAEYTALMRAAYNSSHRNDIFAGWTQAEILAVTNHDKEIAELNKEIDELLLEYDQLSSDKFTDGTAEIYKQLVAKKNKIAKKFNYKNYYEYATVEDYSRDYKNSDLVGFRDNVKTLIEQYKKLSDELSEIKENLTEEQRKHVSDILYSDYDSYGENYYFAYAESYGDQKIATALTDAFEKNYVVFTDHDNSRAGAFNVYLQSLVKNPADGQINAHPFCYFGPGYQDVFTVSHEMGHYYAAYSKEGGSSTDIAETHSQSNEMLLLRFLGGKLPEIEYKALECAQIMNFLSTIIVSTMVDDFENRVYNLESVENFTSKEFDQIMTDVMNEYGGEDYILSNIGDMHNYWRRVALDNAMYYISYAVSATASLGLYATAITDEAKARESYIKLVEVMAGSRFLNALQNSGFRSPFTKGAFQSIEKIVKSITGEM